MARCRAAAAGLAAAAAMTVSACGGGAGTPVARSTPRPTPVALSTGCERTMLPAGYRADAAHSGRLTARNYSAAADVQAALLYDQLQSGDRTVFLHRSASGKVDGVASCVAMQFASAHLAARFLMSYRALRKSAGTLVRPVGLRPVPGLTGGTAFLEHGQSFRGYRIASIDVVEAAGRADRVLDIASVAGAPHPRAVVRRLLRAMSGAVR